MPVNPAEQIDPPKVMHQPMKVLNKDQMDRLLETAAQDPIWHDFYHTELTTGLRLGEICGLMWSDFDERKDSLRVSHTLHRETGGRLVTGDTKTYAGTRTIVLPSSTAELLRAHKKSSCSIWLFHEPLHPETPMNPGTAYRQLKKFLKDTGLPDIRFHDGPAKIGLNQKHPTARGALV